jgi:hypothetical protein
MKIIAVFAVGLALAGVLSAAPAQAQNPRSFVSGHGSDAAACTLAAPCRTFATAYTKTNAGGEITILDPAGYGPLTITTALSIINDGVGEAGVLLTGPSNGITINAGASDAITLRGLSIDGTGAGTYGIQFNTGASLTIANCVIRHFTNTSIFFSQNSESVIAVSNTVVTDNGSSGIEIAPSASGSVTAVFNRVEVNNSFAGISLVGANSTGTIKATVVDSVVANNNFGFLAETSLSPATTLMLFHSVAANNGIGLQADGTGASIRAYQTMVTGNTSGWITNASGVIQSYGNNAIDGNTGGETAPPSVAQK